MPELPEMQALAERLAGYVGGATFTNASVLHFTALKTVDPPPESLAGRTVGRVVRRGKFLVVDFAGPRLLVHLSQGGRVDVETPPKSTRPKFGIVRFDFDTADGPVGVLVKEFGNERQAGWWVLAPDDEGPLARLGPEPDSDAFAAFVRTSDDNRRVHTILRDQRTVAGVGRGWTDDALHRARLSPYASLASLSGNERERLRVSLLEVLDDALAGERQRTGGLPTDLKGRFAVHGKYGQPCPVCGDTLRRVSYEAYEVVYCPTCQTGGKPLADRRLSRLLK